MPEKIDDKKSTLTIRPVKLVPLMQVKDLSAGTDSAGQDGVWIHLQTKSHQAC